MNKIIDKCNIKCKNCSLESNTYNLCISCNTEDNYYPKYNDSLNKNSFINCYNITPERHILDNNIYKPCYETCYTCKGIGENNNHNCISCITNYSFIHDNNDNCYKKCEYYYYFDNENNFNCTNENKCPEGYKLIKEKNKCIDNCINDNIYKYEYNNACYESPISNNIESSFKNEYCENENECPTVELDLIFPNITERRNNLVLQVNNTIYQFTSTFNKKNIKNKNISFIDLGECESKLRIYYNISEIAPLFIFKKDIYEEGLLIPIIEYEVYSNYEPKKKLNLNICKDLKIIILVPALIEEGKEYKHNPYSEYYNDVCHRSTTENGTDIALEDRRKVFINNNLSLCESKCEYEGYDYSIKKSKCKCDIKVNI